MNRPTGFKGRLIANLYHGGIAAAAVVFVLDKARIADPHQRYAFWIGAIAFVLGLFADLVMWVRLVHDKPPSLPFARSRMGRAHSSMDMYTTTSH